jgi:putative salt-induced outer membrane protein YdiY
MRQALIILLGLTVIITGLGLGQGQEKPQAPAQDTPQKKPGQAEPASAPQPPSDQSFAYHSSTSFSFLLAGGNNKTMSFSFDTDQNFFVKRDSLNLKGSIIYAQSNGFKKNEIYYTHLKYNHPLSQGAYLLGLARFERDVRAGYPSRFSFSAGGGWTWIKNGRLNLFSDLAVGWSSENTAVKVNLGDVSGVPLEKTFTSSFVSTIMTGRLTFNLSSNSQVVHQEVLFINMHDLRNYRLNSLSSLSASFSRTFGLKMSVQVNYESKPVPGYRNTDIFLLSSLVIAL